MPGQDARRLRDAALCRKVGASLERSSDYDGSLRWLDQAFSILPSRSGIVGAQICATKSLTLFRKGKYQEAVHWGRVGLSFARRRGDHHQLAYAHHILANSYMELGQLNKALNHDRISVRLYHESGDLAGQARANSNLGLSYQMLGVLDAALYHYDIGLKADQRIGNGSHAAIVHNNLGEVLMLTGRLEEAISHFDEVMHAYKRGSAVVGLAGLAQVNLSRCWLDMGRQAQALSGLRRGLRLLRKAGVQGVLTEALFQQVELRLATGRIPEARRQARRLLRDARGLDAKVLAARGERLLGRAEAALGASERARGHLHTSITIARQAGAEYEEALSLLALARLNLATPRTRQSAGRSFRRAAKILARMGASLDFAGLQALVDGQQQSLIPSAP